MSPTYAKDGYLFYSVSTPSFFSEIELPEEEEEMTSAQRKKLEALKRAAEQHGTYVQTSAYELG